MQALRDCGECGSASLYRCPTCDIRYCSMLCCQKHKRKKCSPPNPPQEEVPSLCYHYPTEDTVEIENLKFLEHSQALRELLRSTQFREILKNIQKQSNPERILKFYMQDPLFTDFVDIILKLVDSKDKITEDNVLAEL